MRIKIVVTFFSVILVGIYLLNLCPTSIGTQRSKPEITNYNHYIENVSEAISFLVVFGLVQNNLETNIASVNITATFYDVENNSIETKVVPTSLEILKPGQKSPFQIYFLLNSSQEAPTRYNLALSYIETTEEPIEELEILNDALRPKVSEVGCYEVSGEVKNKGGRKAWYVHMICIFFNNTDNVIDISHTYVAQKIDPNNKVPFKLSSRPLKEYTGVQVNYELFITVDHYEALYTQNYILLTIIVFVTIGFIVYMKRYRDW